MSKGDTGIDDSVYPRDYSVAYDSTAGPYTFLYSGGDEYAVGDMVTVLYLPERPRMSDSSWKVATLQSEPLGSE